MSNEGKKQFKIFCNCYIYNIPLAQSGFPQEKSADVLNSPMKININKKIFKKNKT